MNSYTLFVVARALVIFSKPIAIYGLLFFGMKNEADIYASFLATIGLGLAFLNCEAHRYYYPSLLSGGNIKEAQGKYFLVLITHGALATAPIIASMAIMGYVSLGVLVVQYLIIFLDKAIDEMLRLYIHKHEFSSWVALSVFRTILPVLFLFFLDSMEVFFLAWALSLLAGILFLSLIKGFLNLKLNTALMLRSFSVKEYISVLREGHVAYLFFAIFSSMVLVYERFIVVTIYPSEAAYFTLAFSVSFVILPFADTVIFAKQRKKWVKSSVLKKSDYGLLIIFSFIFVLIVSILIIFPGYFSTFLSDFHQIIQYLAPCALSALLVVFLYPVTQVVYWRSTGSQILTLEVCALIGLTPSMVSLFFSSDPRVFVWMFTFFFVLRGFLYVGLYRKIKKENVVEVSAIQRLKK